MRYVAAAVVLYLAMDFGNPLIEGAVSFDPGETVDGVRSPELRLIPPVLIVLPSPAAGVVIPVPPPPPAPGRLDPPDVRRQALGPPPRTGPLRPSPATASDPH
jgi:hypothetical protein